MLTVQLESWQLQLIKFLNLDHYADSPNRESGQYAGNEQPWSEHSWFSLGLANKHVYDIVELRRWSCIILHS